MLDAIELDCCGLSEKGKGRAVNDDHYLVAELCKSLDVSHTSLDLLLENHRASRLQGRLLMVAEGVGDRRSSGRASAVAVETAADSVLEFIPWLFRLDPESDDDLRDELGRIVERCHREILGLPRPPGEGGNVAASLTLGYLLWPRLYLIHVGNTRAYLLREGQLRRLTRDHTLSEPALALDPRDAGVDEESPELLWNTLGGESDSPFIEVRRAHLERGDSVLLCTDGLTGSMTDEGIRDILRAESSAQAACTRLIEAARQSEIEDDVTAVVGSFRKPLDEVALRTHLESSLEDAARPLPASSGPPVDETREIQQTES